MPSRSIPKTIKPSTAHLGRNTLSTKAFVTVTNLVIHFIHIVADSIYKRSFNGDMALELAKQKRRLVRDTMSKLGVTGY